MNPFVITGVANAAIGANRAVVADNTYADGVKVPTAAVSSILGVTQYAASAAGATVAVQVDGLAEVVATSAVSVGDAVKVDTAGGVVTASATDKCVGVVRRAAGAGEIASILLKPFTA